MDSNPSPLKYVVTTAGIGLAGFLGGVGLPLDGLRLSEWARGDLGIVSWLTIPVVVFSVAAALAWQAKAIGAAVASMFTAAKAVVWTVACGAIVLVVLGVVLVGAGMVWLGVQLWSLPRVGG